MAFITRVGDDFPGVRFFDSLTPSRLTDDDPVRMLWRWRYAARPQLLIRRVMHECAARGLTHSEIRYRMHRLGCRGLYPEVLSMFFHWGTGSDLDTGGDEEPDLHWRPDWDIAFCRATGDWRLIRLRIRLMGLSSKGLIAQVRKRFPEQEEMLGWQRKRTPSTSTNGAGQ